MIKIATKKNGRISLRKQEGLSAWFEQIVQNGSEIKLQNCKRKLENSNSLIANTSFTKPRQMPLLGCSSLRYDTTRQLQTGRLMGNDYKPYCAIIYLARCLLNSY
eukprot:TRINITY_DN14448_c0_g1_i1.p1 TRINITY_DN14448_c0_g1~~TRINITY_DN14448_c0_g1_i1.p1  ORF type:complete len:105 (-),score=12.76 TRINITY_DN14448_c0_g1_i1:112-426(-)